MLDDFVNKYNNTVLRTIKMKPIDITGGSDVESNEEFNKKDPKFKVSIQSIYFILFLFCKLSTNNCSHDHTNSL